MDKHKPRAVIVETAALSEANERILDAINISYDYKTNVPQDSLDLVITRITDVAVLEHFKLVDDEVLESVKYNLNVLIETLIHDAKTEYEGETPDVVVNSITLLTKNLASKIKADIDSNTKFAEDNFKNVEGFQKAAKALGVYAVILPQIQQSKGVTAVDSVDNPRLDLSGTPMATLRKAGSIVAVAGIIAVAGASPSQAQNVKHSTTVSTEEKAHTQTVQPALSLVAHTNQTPSPDEATSSLDEQPQTEEQSDIQSTESLNSEQPPIVLGQPLEPIVVQIDQVSSKKKTSVFTTQAALPNDSSLEEDLQNIEYVEDSPIAKDIKDSLIDDIELVQDKMLKAIKTGDFTAFGEDTAFNRKDPANKDQVLRLVLAEQHRALLAKHMGDINRVLENDQDTIEKLMKFFAHKYADTEYTELNDQIAKFIVETKFTENALDLSMSQKILLMAIYSTVHEELSSYADAQYQKALQQYKEDHPAPKPKPIHIENDGPDYSNEEWNGNFKITERHLRIIDSWPLSKAGKKIMPEIITTIINEADEKGLNPAIEIVRVLYETGMLKDDLSSKHFNYMGIKAGSSWEGDFVQVATHEDYGNGLVVVRHKFRSYDTPTEGLHDFFEIRQKDTYADARRFHLSPELYMSGDLGMLSKDGEVIGLQGQPGVLGWSTGRSVPYTALSLIARFNVDKIVPKHFLQGYDWNQKTYDGNPLPETIRGKTYYNQHDARYAHNPYRRHDSPRNYNVSTSGCMPTSLAIIVSNLTGKEVTPMDMIRFSLKHGFRTRDAGTSDSMVEAVARAYGLKVRNLAQNAQAFQNGLQNGGMALVSGRDSDKQTPGTSSGHIYVVDNETQRGKSIRFQVLDANSTPNSLNNYTFSELSRDPNTGADSMRRAWLLTK